MMQPHLLPDDVPVDPIDEQLVAYLDGELDQAERDALEQRLVDDPTLRQRLQKLQGGWEMLDELPQSSVRGQFTETTLELVAADASRDVKAVQSRRWRQHWTLPAVALLLTAVAMVVGAGAVIAARQWELRRQLRDLPLAQHLDAYRYADDLAFMTMLADDPQWQAHMDAAVKLRQMRFPESEFQTIPISQRDEALAELGIRDRERLAFNWREFERLSDEQREQIRDLAERVQSHPQRQELLQTMDGFARWYQSLDKETQTAIRESDGEQREQLMRQAMEKSRRDWISRSGPLLNADDVDAIYDVMHTAAGDWVQLVRRNPETIPLRPRFSLMRRISSYAAEYNQSSPEAALLNYVFVVQNPLRFPAESVWGAQARELHALFSLTDQDYETIPFILSDAARDHLDAAAPTRELQRELLDQWIYEAVLRTTGEGVRVERLMAMDPEQREALELAPPATIFGRLDRSFRGSPSPPLSRPPSRTFRGEDSPAAIGRPSPGPPASPTQPPPAAESASND